MRIIAGEWRGRPLVAPAGATTRPTGDRTREALFSDPQHAYTRALFAATPRADVESIKARLARRAAGAAA